MDISPIDNSGKLVENGNHIRLYYHMDYLGTTDYLTSPVSGKVEAWTHYNEWGLITHNAVLKCGQRELDLVKRYATHDYDSVLELYYAKARFYDAHDRHFTAVDPILDPSGYDLREYVKDPVQLVQYLYVKDNAINWIDPLGLTSVKDADQLIKNNKETILAAARAHNVDPGIVAGVIYAEQILNYDWKDEFADVPFYYLNTSVGIGQVRISTARLLEDKEYVDKTYYVRYECHCDYGNYPKRVEVWYAPGYGEVYGNRDLAIAKRLTVDSQNIKYVAAYLNYIQDYWKNTYDISGRPDILGTLYNIGEGSPNTSPQSNDFGKEVQKQYGHMLELLGIAA